MHVLFGYFVPCVEKDTLQRVHFRALYSAVHVVPLAYSGSALDVVVGHVHAARIGHLAVYDYDLAMVSREHVVNPRKSYWVELVYLYAPVAYSFEVSSFQWTVVAGVAKRVEQSANFHALDSLGGQQVEQLGSDGVVSEIEIFKVYARFSLLDGLE